MDLKEHIQKLSRETGLNPKEIVKKALQFLQRQKKRGKIHDLHALPQGH